MSFQLFIMRNERLRHTPRRKPDYVSSCDERWAFQQLTVCCCLFLFFHQTPNPTIQYVHWRTSCTYIYTKGQCSIATGHAGMVFRDVRKPHGRWKSTIQTVARARDRTGDREAVKLPALATRHRWVTWFFFFFKFSSMKSDGWLFFFANIKILPIFH